MGPFIDNEFLRLSLMASVLVACTCAVAGTFVVLRGLARRVWVEVLPPSVDVPRVPSAAPLAQVECDGGVVSGFEQPDGVPPFGT